MKPSALLTNLRAKAENMSRDGALVGWFHRQGKVCEEFMPLGDLRVMAIYRGHKTRTYRFLKKKEIEVKDALPAYLISSPAVFFDGRVHVGGDNWFQRTRGPKTFYYRESVPGSRPSGEFRDIVSDNPQKEVTLVTSIKHERALADRQLCRWGLQMLDDSVEEQTGFNRFGDEEIMPPPFLVPRKKYCLELREGTHLRELVENIFKRQEWHVEGVSGLSAPDRGRARVFHTKSGPPSQQGIVSGFLKETGSVLAVEFSHDNGCEDLFELDAIQESVEEFVFRIFGVRLRIDLMPAFASGEEVPMRAKQALFTPAPEGTTLEKLRAFWKWEDRRAVALAAGMPFTEEPPLPQGSVQAMKYVAALTTSQDINGVTALDVDVAVGNAEPYVHMGALMCRIQRVTNLEDNLMYESPGVNIDLPHVCARMALQRRSQLFRERVAAIKSAPGVEVPEAQVMHASSGS